MGYLYTRSKNYPKTFFCYIHARWMAARGGIYMRHMAGVRRRPYIMQYGRE